MNMDQATAERWVTISALVVIAVYGYRRIVETPQPGTLRNILGQGPPVPLGQFVTAWGFTFFVIAMLAEASPSVGGSFAILVAAADLLNNLQPALADVKKQQTATTASASSSTAGAFPFISTLTPSNLTIGQNPLVAPAPITATPASLSMSSLMSYLTGQGLNRTAAAGVVGNLQQESSLNPAAPGGGLAQWQAPRGPSSWTVSAQLQYLVNDLHSTYSGLLGQMNAAASPAAAAVLFQNQYEKPNPAYANQPARIQYAWQAYAAG